MARSLGWYWNRLRRMSPAEVAVRSRDAARRAAWRRLQVRPGEPWPPLAASMPRTFPSRLPAAVAAEVPDAARRAVLEAADRLLDGHLEVLGVERSDLQAPDWFLDPISGRRAPQDRYCFAVDHRSELEVGNVKQIWELSRHHHLTVLASAWFVSGDDRYAEAVAIQLRDWWRANPFLSGIHWTSGIELGIRLISWTWIRRLLDAWPGVTALFDENDTAAQQISWHLTYLAAFSSTGSSANNHVVAEAAGQLVAACAFPWFEGSERWREQAAGLLEQLAANTFPSGLNRELASDYHCLVADLGLVAAVEADVSGRPLSDGTWALLAGTFDAAAAVVDQRCRPPRQGDGDDGRALLMDGPHDNHWPSMLAAGATCAGALPWWPDEHLRPADVRNTLLGALASPRTRAGRASSKPSHFADAGLTILRTAPEGGPEIWCRCDAGPHGFLAIAAHAHADALSVEVRHGGVVVLADPGTYCYHGEPAWRTYFRSTIGHNTLEVDRRDQSVSGGPFLWVEHASTQLLDVAAGADTDVLSWSAEHAGYRRLAEPAIHRRTVTLDRATQTLSIADRLESKAGHDCRLALHLGPQVAVELNGASASLSWPCADAADGQATAAVDLPPELAWSVHCGQVDPVLGWYSAGFGRKEPSSTLVGVGSLGTACGELRTLLRFGARS